MKDKTKRSRLPLVMGFLLLAAAGLWLAFRLMWTGGGGIPGDTEQQRISYIESFGWDAGITRCDVKEIRIPVNFDEVYEEYNDIQRSQGFDLRKYRAHSVRQYTYEVSRTDDDPVPCWRTCWWKTALSSVRILPQPRQADSPEHWQWIDKSPLLMYNNCAMRQEAARQSV